MPFHPHHRLDQAFYLVRRMANQNRQDQFGMEMKPFKPQKNEDEHQGPKQQLGLAVFESPPPHGL